MLFTVDTNTKRVERVQLYGTFLQVSQRSSYGFTVYPHNFFILKI